MFKYFYFSNIIYLLIDFLSSFNNENNADLKTDSKTLNNKAQKKFLTVKLSTNLSANKIIQALITNRNKPKVTMVAGKVKNTKSGRTNIFSSEITIATIIADTYPSTEIPGKILAKTITAKAVNKIFKKVFIFF